MSITSPIPLNTNRKKVKRGSPLSSPKSPPRLLLGPRSPVLSSRALSSSRSLTMRDPAGRNITSSSIVTTANSHPDNVAVQQIQQNMRHVHDAHSILNDSGNVTTGPSASPARLYNLFDLNQQHHHNHHHHPLQQNTDYSTSLSPNNLNTFDFQSQYTPISRPISFAEMTQSNYNPLHTNANTTEHYTLSDSVDAAGGLCRHVFGQTSSKDPPHNEE